MGKPNKAFVFVPTGLVFAQTDTTSEFSSLQFFDSNSPVYRMKENALELTGIVHTMNALVRFVFIFGSPLPGVNSKNLNDAE